MEDIERFAGKLCLLKESHLLKATSDKSDISLDHHDMLLSEFGLPDRPVSLSFDEEFISEEFWQSLLEPPSRMSSAEKVPSHQDSLKLGHLSPPAANFFDSALNGGDSEDHESDEDKEEFCKNPSALHNEKKFSSQAISVVICFYSILFIIFYHWAPGNASEQLGS